MYLTKTIPIPIYTTAIKFIVTGDILKSVNKVYKKHNCGMFYKDLMAGCSISLSINTYYIILDKDYLTPQYINHEILHSILAITQDRGIYEEESRCYLMGIVSKEIYDFLKSKKVSL